MVPEGWRLVETLELGAMVPVPVQLRSLEVLLWFLEARPWSWGEQKQGWFLEVQL